MKCRHCHTEITYFSSVNQWIHTSTKMKQCPLYAESEEED